MVRFLDIRVNDKGIGMSVVDSEEDDPELYVEDVGYFLWEYEKWSNDNTKFVWWLYHNLVAIGYDHIEMRNDFEGDIRTYYQDEEEEDEEVVDEDYHYEDEDE